MSFGLNRFLRLNRGFRYSLLAIPVGIVITVLLRLNSVSLKYVPDIIILLSFAVYYRINRTWSKPSNYYMIIASILGVLLAFFVVIITDANYHYNSAVKEGAIVNESRIEATAKLLTTWEVYTKYSYIAKVFTISTIGALFLMLIILSQINRSKLTGKKPPKPSSNWTNTFK